MTEIKLDFKEYQSLLDVRDGRRWFVSPLVRSACVQAVKELHRLGRLVQEERLRAERAEAQADKLAAALEQVATLREQLKQRELDLNDQTTRHDAVISEFKKLDGDYAQLLEDRNFLSGELETQKRATRLAQEQAKRVCELEESTRVYNRFFDQIREASDHAAPTREQRNDCDLPF